ncbi:MAG: beta-propeller fold lactonase family protein [Acidobacteriaceae bacterium]|nr:beta-propeller fold lactonase family protein [Acidobacteriaceae bacterium]MBV9501265.1 beta-propeller fold lactonase family protein [Acidobacteriaceae bacterium]
MKRSLTSFTIALALGCTTLGFARQSHSDDAGAVFVMTNAADKNEIIAYNRAANGALKEVSKFDTGGRGSGGLVDPLESQGSLILTRNHAFLLAVNAGSGSISVFRVDGPRLSLADVVHSGGSEPNALAQFDDLVYVLNTGGSSGVAGFKLNENGKLTSIPNSVRFLSTNTSGAASLSFSPDGRFLVVTERLTDNIDVFSVHGDGTLSSVVLNQDSLPGTFAVTFAPNGSALVVETGAAGAQNGSTISSYGILDDGSIFPISAGVPTLGAATCWNAVTPDGRFVYTNNAGSSNISGFTINGNGTLTALPNTIQASNPNGSANIDLTISADGKFLYSLNAGIGSIGIFAINKDGSLKRLGFIGGVSAKSGFNGIAAL